MDNQVVSESAFPLAKAGYPFILAGAFVTVVFALIGYAAFALFFLMVTIFVCFGSRLDVYLLADARLEVALGDKVKAGTSVLGYM